jgi:hypothetical protein
MTFNFARPTMNQNWLFQHAKNLQWATDMESLPTAYFKQDVVLLRSKALCVKFLDAAMVRMNQLVDHRGDQA